MKKITFVTGNKKKVEEVSRIINHPLAVLQADIDEIQGVNLEKIALDKLNKAYKLVKGPVIIDDVSIEIEAWKGFPGPLIKWMLKVENDSAGLLLKLLKNEKNRKAVAKLAIGYHDGKKTHIFIGEIEGNIASSIRGDNGFGWDPVFIPKGMDKTYAELSDIEKDKISHRKKALDKLSDFLNNN